VKFEVTFKANLNYENSKHYFGNDCNPSQILQLALPEQTSCGSVEESLLGATRSFESILKTCHGIDSTSVRRLREALAVF
jgi:hypothetical protein